MLFTKLGTLVARHGRISTEIATARSVHIAARIETHKEQKPAFDEVERRTEQVDEQYYRHAAIYYLTLTPSMLFSATYCLTHDVEYVAPVMMAPILIVGGVWAGYQLGFRRIKSKQD